MTSYQIGIALWWLGSCVFVLSFARFVTHFTDKYKPIVKGIQPRVEVYGKNYKKISTPGRVLNKKC